MTTVAKYSPSGFYIASAGTSVNYYMLVQVHGLHLLAMLTFIVSPFPDQTGKIRIWDTVQKEHILKNEFQPFVGIVKDLAWSPDSQRIMAVGEGRER